MAIDDFLSHKTSGGRGAYLTGWKKDGKIDTWMHTQRLPMAVWRHTHIPKIVVLEDKKTGESVRRVWSGEWVCHEDESVLVEQYRTNNQGVREKPPEHCPLCRLVDYVRRAVKAGRIKWTTPLFKWEGDAEFPQETTILHAGPMFMTRRDYDELDADEVKAAKKAGVHVKDSWKENCYAKAEYLFCVVDNAHPESGVQKVFNTSSLGDKVKDVIADMRESKGVEKGDPTIHPYCIQWQFRENETDPKRMYHALAVEKVKLTPAVKKLISGPPPDIDRDVQPFNVEEMRAYLEEHCLVKLPWDDIFKVKTREHIPPSRQTPEASEDEGGVVEEVEEEEEAEPEPEPTPAKGAKKRGAKQRAPFPDDDDDHAVACENPECGKAIWDDVHECVHCGAEYDEDFKLVKSKAKEAPKGPKKRGAKANGHGVTEETREQVAKHRRKIGPSPESPPEREPGQDDEEDLENIDPLPFARVERGAVEGWHGSNRPKWERF